MNTQRMDATLHKTLLDTLRHYWGYTHFRPMQEEAIEAILANQDSLVILPTGGGKSLCFQLPALLMDGTALVVSPLISLMKDQVDTLRQLGIAAGVLNSSLDYAERQQVEADLRHGKLKLLYVSPERFASADFLNLIKYSPLSFLVVDEAHCISHWGHNFRPEYRELGRLRDRFPRLPIHAFTATATQQVQDDIAQALHLERPRRLVGSFDRPNLTYRVLPRTDAVSQVTGIIQAHPGEAGIVYCIRRKDVDTLTEALCQAGHRALPYHAGLSDSQRQANQEAFMQEQADVIVATVAFGMGIDRANIRYVIHAGMPKSIEHYQQEAGRAGRDGQPAECILLYGKSDPVVWRRIVGPAKTAQQKVVLDKLREMVNYCTAELCRHRMLVAYFGQAFEKSRCNACDVCLEAPTPTMVPVGVALMDVAPVVLGLVSELRESQPPRYVQTLLLGANRGRITRQGHHKLKAYGAFRAREKETVEDWLGRLQAMELLRVNPRGNLMLTLNGRLLLKGQPPNTLGLPEWLVPPDTASVTDTSVLPVDPADEALLAELKQLRLRLAQEAGLPPDGLFSDETLVEMARRKPTTLAEFQDIPGIGRFKLEHFCPACLDLILTHLALPPGRDDETGIDTEALLYSGVWADTDMPPPAEEDSNDDRPYLARYVASQGFTEPDAWVDRNIYEGLCRALLQAGQQNGGQWLHDLDLTPSAEEVAVALALIANRLALPPKLQATESEADETHASATVSEDSEAETPVPEETPLAVSPTDGLDGPMWEGAYLPRADFQNASLARANFRYAFLESADFTGADLTGADFTGARLCGATFAGAMVHGTCFQETDLVDADMRGALYDSTTRFPRAYIPPRHGLIQQSLASSP